jgi:polar amino acid transport system substrate-binding protein
MKKKILALFVSCFSLCADELLVGTNAEFPPFCYIENKTIVGFDIDVVTEVAKRLGKTAKIKDMPFDALLPGIALGSLDVVAAGMSYTEERGKRALFTKSYLNGNLVILASQQSLGLENLKGKTVVVVEGYTADAKMSSCQGIKLLRLPTQADAFLALKSGRADAFVTASNTVKPFLDLQDSSKYPITPLEGTGESCALVIPLTKRELLVKIQEALDAMEQDGTLAGLRNKWKLS